MPKIEAATVAEHRALRERSVIGAAVGILVTEGAAAVTPGAVAREAGLARTSVYQYFPSTGALLGAALEALATQREQRISTAVENAGPDARERIAAYVRTAVRLAHDSSTPVADLDSVPPEVRRRLEEFDERAQQPLRTAIAQLGVADPEPVTVLVEASLAAAAGMVTDEEDVERVAGTVTAFVMAGMDATLV